MRLAPSQLRTATREFEPRWIPGLVGIGLLAFALRAAFALTNRANLGLGMDTLWYSRVATEIAHGNPIKFVIGESVGGQLHLVRVPTAAHGILFPLVLAGADVLGATTVTAQKLVGCGVGACAVVVVGIVGRELGGRRVGLLAAGLAAVYPPLVMNDSLIMSEPLYGLLGALAVLAVLRLRHRPGPWLALAFGTVVGLAALTRTEAPLLLLFLGVPVLWTTRGHWRQLGIAAAAAVVVMSPWVIRNWQVFGGPTLSTNIGSVVVAANCRDTYYGQLIGGWSASCLSAASRYGIDRNELRQSDRWLQEGTAYAQRHPFQIPVVAAARILRTFNLYPLDPGQQARVAQGTTGGSLGFNLLCVWSGLVLLLLAVLGLRYTNREARLALLPLVALTATLVAVSDSVPRMREPADIALVVVAAHGLARGLPYLLSRCRLPRRRGNRVIA